MGMQFKWNRSMDAIAKDVTGGKRGMLFLANEAARLMDPYVPADKLVLAQNIRITADSDCGHILYDSPYAHYQYEGELYVSSKTGSAWAREGEYKVKAGKKIKQSKFRHPLATSHWDKAMQTARGDDMAKSYQLYLKGKKK